jgi:hypothetical protein
MTSLTPQTSQLSRLYVEGERLGWTFRDRNVFRYRFLEPYPVPRPIPVQLVNAAQRAGQKMAGRMVISGAIGVGVAVLLFCCGSFASISSKGAGTPFIVMAVLAVLCGVAGIGLVWAHAANAKSTLARAQQEQQQAHQAACMGWEQRRAAHEAAEHARVDQFDEWGAADPPPGTRRVDIVGGSLWGWEALLTVFGGSLLRSRGSLVVVDFTGEAACRELVRLAEENETPVDVKLLPGQLAETNLLSRLTARQLVDALIESMYGDVPTGSRADRAQDDRLLTAVCEALGEDLTMARIAAALRVLMGEPGEHPVLTPAERQTIADNLFADEFKRQSHPSLRRIESYIHPLEALGSHTTGELTAALTCLVDESDGRSARRELLKDLIIQWLIRRVSAQNLPCRSLIIVGADEISHLHIERFTDLCERRDIRLVMMFRHLRDASVHAIGGGAVGFMRLANHEEARQAAEFVGRHHKFTLTELTRTLGGNETHSVADSVGQQTSRGGGWSPGGHHSNWGVSRSWGQTITRADGTSWSDAASAQRVYEYAVEPRALQDLPDYALLLVKGQGNGSVLQPVECNPEIVMLPRMTMQPLPNIALPDPNVAAIPMAGSPTHLTVSQPTQIGAMTPPPAAYARGVLPGWGSTGPVSAPPVAPMPQPAPRPAPAPPRPPQPPSDGQPPQQ